MPVYQSEKDVKREVKKLLTKHKWFYWMPAANAHGRSGCPDFLAMRGGVFLAVETKYKKNKPNGPQRAFGQSLLAEGAFSFVVNEDLIPVLARWMERFDESIACVQDRRVMPEELGPEMLEDIRLLTEMLVSAKEAPDAQG